MEIDLPRNEKLSLQDQSPLSDVAEPLCSALG